MVLCLHPVGFQQQSAQSQMFEVAITSEDMSKNSLKPFLSVTAGTGLERNVNHTSNHRECLENYPCTRWPFVPSMFDHLLSDSATRKALTNRLSRMPSRKKGRPNRSATPPHHPPQLLPTTAKTDPESQIPITGKDWRLKDHIYYGFEDLLPSQKGSWTLLPKGSKDAVVHT